MKYVLITEIERSYSIDIVSQFYGQIGDRSMRYNLKTRIIVRCKRDFFDLILNTVKFVFFF